MRFYIYRDKNGEWRWRLIARNGLIMADSAEGYKRKAKCVAALTKILLSVHKYKYSIIVVTSGQGAHAGR